MGQIQSRMARKGSSQLTWNTGRTLDVGCGAGRVALHLQQSGIEVVGIDHSPLAVQTCRERGLSDVRVMPVTQISSNRLGVFDSITMIGNNFGLVGNPKRAHWLLRRFFRMTTKHGRILAESTDPYATDDPLHLAYQERNRQQGRMSRQYRHRELYRNLSAWLIAPPHLIAPPERGMLLGSMSLAWHHRRIASTPIPRRRKSGSFSVSVWEVTHPKLSFHFRASYSCLKKGGSLASDGCLDSGRESCRPQDVGGWSQLGR